MRKLIIIGSLICFLGFGFATDFLYFGLDTCPHCIKVDKFLNENKFYEKFDIQKKEASTQENQQSLFGYCEKLGIKDLCGSVPMMVIDDDGNLSYQIGDANIIDYFNQVSKSNASKIADKLDKNKISKVNEYISNLIKKVKDTDKLNNMESVYQKMIKEQNNFRYAELLIKIIDIYKS